MRIELAKVKQQIAEFRDLFADDPVGHVSRGTWFPQLVKLVLETHAQKVNAVYFQEKYPGLDRQRIARRLVDSAANHMSVAGGAAGATASAAELAALAGPAAWAAFGATIIGELTYITYHQLQLVYDLSVVLDAELDREDPEDIMTVFWMALGINRYEEAANLALKAGPRGAAYLGRKALRAGVRQAMQEVAKKFGGTVLARKVTERTVLKLFVPGINIPIAAGVNYFFTKKLGRLAIRRLTHRGTATRPLKELMGRPRRLQLLAVPTVYHVGIEGEDVKKLSRAIEMQAVMTRMLAMDEGEREVTSRLVDLDFDGYVVEAREVDDVQAADALADIAVCAHLTSGAESSRDRLFQFAEAVKQGDGLERRIKRIAKKLDV